MIFADKLSSIKGFWEYDLQKGTKSERDATNTDREIKYNQQDYKQ